MCTSRHLGKTWFSHLKWRAFGASVQPGDIRISNVISDRIHLGFNLKVIRNGVRGERSGEQVQEVV